jgi:peptide chain release factor 2
VSLEKIEKEISDLLELIAIIETPSDLEKDDVEKQFKEIKKEIDTLEFQTLLSGEFDASDAIIAIHAGAGGVDAQDWAEMLLRMYLRWAELSGLKARVVDESRGTEAGIKSVTIEVDGNYAYGNLKSEAGVHRLVRLSPFNSDNLRQTSFASVEVMPVIEEIKEVKINPQDLVIDTYRSSGAGGQHVNTTDSAVRITHVPTNIVVTCQSERSQLQNREQAMKVLKARIHQRYLEEQEAERRKLKGEVQSNEWGSQIRSYVIHPYKLVKDHRTKFETSDAEKVLDGELHGFMEAYLRYEAGQKI